MPKDLEYWRDRAYMLAAAVAGGEDVIGVIEDTPTESFVDALATERAIAREDRDRVVHLQGLEPFLDRIGGAL